MNSKQSFGIKERDQLYRLIVSQLFYDGYQNLAIQLANTIKVHLACPPSDRLLKVFCMGTRVEEENTDTDNALNAGETFLSGRGIDLEFQTEVKNKSPEAFEYETCYVTAHKGPCRTAAFHPNGQLIATGSEDSSIKILDVERMLMKSSMPFDMLQQETPQQQMENHPVIRTLYDHTAEITTVDFHPTHHILASGSKDFSVKFFDYSKPSVKKAHQSIQEASEIRCVSFHPTGDYILVGTQHPTLRLYDVRTAECFVSSHPRDQHTGPVTSVSYNNSGSLFVTSSKDGTLKVWSGTSNRCINTFSGAHDGYEVCSAVISDNSKYILSSGKDSLVKLWELSTSRCLIAYTGAGVTGKQEHRSNAIFNHTEDYVLFPDEKTTSLCCWDSRNADRQKLLSLGHNGLVRCIAHSPNSAAFLSCSEDYRARFWYKKNEEAD